MKRIAIYAAVTLILSVAALLVTGQTQLITFQAGDVIKADEVNQNFQSLASEIAGKQTRVTAACSDGSAIRVINADGTVECEVDNVGAADSAGVASINGKTDALVLEGGTNLSVDNSQAGKIVLNATASGDAGNNHDHMGQVWTGNDTPLTLKGSFTPSNFDSADGAPLVLDNPDGLGLRILTTDADGIWVNRAGDDGVQVEGATGDGIYVNIAGDNGFSVDDAGRDGLAVSAATRHGVYVAGAGEYGGTFTGAKAGLYALGEGTAPDLILGANGAGTDDDNGIISSDPAQPGSDIFLEAQDLVVVSVGENDNPNEGGFYVLGDVGNVTMLEPGGKFLDTSTGAFLSAGGTWTNASDINLKTNFSAVNIQAILASVAALPLSSWQYKKSPDVTHIGPMAQDFSAAFGLGADNTSIATVDADGVALAAIQGLYELVQAKDAQIAALEMRLAELESKVK